MATKESDPRFFGIGLAMGVALMALFMVISVCCHLSSGYYGVPPNGTWYHPAPGAEAPATPHAEHH